MHLPHGLKTGIFSDSRGFERLSYFQQAEIARADTSNSASLQSSLHVYKLNFFSSDFAFYFPTKGVNDYVNIWGMPSLKQFTLCFWMKSRAGNDGTVLSYAVPGQHNELLFFDHTNINMYIGGQGRFVMLLINL